MVITELDFIILDNAHFIAKNALGETVFEYTHLVDIPVCVDVWKSFSHDEQVRAIYEYKAAFSFQNKQQVFGSITDLSETDGSFDGSSEWLIKEYMPKAVKYGYKYNATIHAKDFYAQLAYEELEEIERDFEMMLFEDHETALNWLKEKLQII